MLAQTTLHAFRSTAKVPSAVVLLFSTRTPFLQRAPRGYSGTPTYIHRRSHTTVLQFAKSSFPSTMAPPQHPPRWSHSPEDVLSLTAETIQQNRAVLDQIAKVPREKCNFKSIFVTLAHAEATFESSIEPLSFYQNVSTSKLLRDASNKAEQLARDYAVEASMRADIFRVKQHACQNIQNSGEWSRLSDEDRRLVDKMILEGKRSGLALPEAQRSELIRIKKELSHACLDFGKNFNEEKSHVTFTAKELVGVPADVISGYKKQMSPSGEVQYQVTFQTPDIMPLLKYAQDPETRRLSYEGYEGRLSVNAPLLSKILDLRRKAASLLGYRSWADYVTEDKMAKTSQTVVDFLDDLEQKLKPVGHENIATLLKLKEEEYKELGLPFDGQFWLHDTRYYDRLFVEKSLALDDSLVKEYFPVAVVIPRILEVYQHLLGVTFQPINGETWHPEVYQFAVWDQNAKDETGFLGYCYFDLFPRESKYSHAAVWPLLAGHQNLDGTRSYPVVAMVANLAKPTADRPALMRHDDVVTFFHEMGHALHGLCSRTKYSRFHGTNVARDFVEVPSQMLENWCWEPAVLQRMSSHYKTGEPLSDDLVSKIIQSRHVNVGIFYLRQVFFAKFDIAVHHPPLLGEEAQSPDYTKLWHDLRESISLIPGSKRVAGQGTFAHITGGYDAGYYGYTYSLVFAQDMYHSVFKKDPLDRRTGQHYRQQILKVGSSRDESQSLLSFLGRAPNSEAFLHELFPASSS